MSHPSIERLNRHLSHLSPSSPSIISPISSNLARDDAHFKNFSKVSHLLQNNQYTKGTGFTADQQKDINAGYEYLASKSPLKSLKGQTLFITGASRGIGLAIALKAARDGANIVVAAKTVDPQPNLPGTIFTAAKEIEAAGGRALPVQVDIRDENSIKRAVQAAVKEFGGIDILVNNASAISLTPIESTTTKKFDLMNGIETRGTFLCTRECIPYLKKSKNGHILNLSPPLWVLQEKWLAPHAPYTLAKFSMSILALGGAGELRDAGVASNCLWPRTVIATAAVQNLLGGDDTVSKSRTPEIMADSAYEILTSDSRKCSGFFFIDEDVLRARGVKDFSKYTTVKGTKDEDLALDFFI